MDVKIKNLGKFEFLKGTFEVARGLRFKNLKSKEGVILESPVESRTGIIADMLFVFYSIDMAFLDSNKKVVDIRRNVKPFISLVVPKKKAKYLVEMRAGEMENLREGAKLNF